MENQGNCSTTNLFQKIFSNHPLVSKQKIGDYLIGVVMWVEYKLLRIVNKFIFHTKMA